MKFLGIVLMLLFMNMNLINIQRSIEETNIFLDRIAKELKNRNEDSK